ncbi:G protein-activated inward rectifier potassium channel 3-like [Uloborus diversus]|uniref:G protein-activated inward rectifier potassium channel 3-like n=1 Tax=Uloborus diversus TaxID=327109 RepID=UPI0024091CE2|nr:G protein-activated inward rectifier potassium channel 3-like [Uloborus diversus]XP_054711921.1 G protein-activated inward rectifier potassium channel 3-like [Uloborus diversus]
MKCMDPDNSAVWQLLPGKDHKLDIEGESPTPTENGVLSSNGTLSKCSTVPRNMCLNGFSKEKPTAFYPKFRHSRVVQNRNRRRVILKNGGVNICRENVSKRSQRYLQDIFITMVDIQWRWNLCVFAMGFFVSWIVFAVIWWLIAYAHGDLEHTDHEKWDPCVKNVHSFVTAFLFSVESQHTIGYGFRYTTEECPEGVFMMCIQSVTGVMIQCLVAGMVFAKLSRPKKRSQTLMFSRYAVVCMRDGKLCMLWRVGDMRKSHIIGAQISAQVISRKVTVEGEVIPYYHTQLEVRCDDAGDRVFLIWPATIVHEINETSPFYNMSAQDVLSDNYELIVALEGTIESTGQAVQARTSFVPTEILWGHRFEQMVCYNKETGEFLVDYRKFNSTYEIETPLCSAHDFYEYRRAMSVSSRAVSYSVGTNEASSLASFRRSESTTEEQSSSSQVQVSATVLSTAGSGDEC